MKTVVQIENITRSEFIELIQNHSAKADKKENDQNEELMTSRETAMFLGRSLQTLVRWRQEGIIPFYGTGRTIYHKKSEILEALRKNPKLNK